MALRETLGTSSSIATVGTLPHPMADSISTAPPGQLIAAALVGIAVLVLLITWLKMHPFIALTLGSLTTGIVAASNVADTAESFSDGFGSTMGGVGILIALGAIYGKLLADSGGADEIVDTLLRHAGPRSLPWVMGLIGAIIGAVIAGASYAAITGAQTAVADEEVGNNPDVGSASRAMGDPSRP